jgi:hypothetical protein
LFNKDTIEELKSEDEEESPTINRVSELAKRNDNKIVITGGRDRTIVISDVVEMKKLGEITLKNCSNEGYRFIGLKRNEEIWVCTLNDAHIYVYNLKDIIDPLYLNIR